jgi:hypothetical protein
MTKSFKIFFQNSKGLNGYILPVFYLFISLYILSKPTFYYPDSYSFLDNDIHRSALFRAYLSVFKYLFGGGFEIGLKLFQLLLNILAIEYVLKTIAKLLDIKRYLLFVIRFSLVLPLVYQYFVVNSLLTEALCYPLFLLLLANIIKGFDAGNWKHYVYAMIFLTLLIGLRGQFLFVLPVLLFIWTYQVLTKRLSKITFLLLILSIPFQFFVNELIEKSVNKLQHGVFTTAPFTGVHLASSVFYLSEAKDSIYFDDELLKSYFNFIHNELKNENLLSSQLIETNENYPFFHENFSEIANATLHEKGMAFLNSKHILEPQNLKRLDDINKAVAYKLISKNFLPWLKLWFDNFKNAIGGIYFACFYTIVFLLFTFHFLYFNNKNSAYFSITILMMFSNILVVTLVIHSIDRYLFYFYWIPFFIFTYLFNLSLKTPSVNAY